MTGAPGVADVEVLGQGGAVDLVVEVPHGADRHADYQALRARLAGPLPAHLEEFFFVNTDVGAYQVGRRVAERVGRRAIVVRSRIPRTFIDCNRIEEATEGDLASGGLTASVPAYVTSAADRALLLDLHRRYVAVVEEAVAQLAPRGLMFMPHTYGPVTLGIERVDETIVDKLRWAHEPERYATWPVRPEIDFISRTADGTSHAAGSVVAAAAAGLRAAGLEVAENRTYHMHPSTLGHRWALRLPGRTLCVEARRDLLMQRFTWNQENHPDAARVDRVAAPLAEAISAFLS